RDIGLAAGQGNKRQTEPGQTQTLPSAHRLHGPYFLSQEVTSCPLQARVPGERLPGYCKPRSWVNTDPAAWPSRFHELRNAEVFAPVHIGRGLRKNLLDLPVELGRIGHKVQC